MLNMYSQIQQVPEATARFDLKPKRLSAAPRVVPRSCHKLVYLWYDQHRQCSHRWWSALSAGDRAVEA